MKQSFLSADKAGIWPVKKQISFPMNRILFLLLACCLVLGCKKNNTEPMSSPTQSGKNIVACKVNGKVHIYEGTHDAFHGDGVEFYKMASIDTYLYVWADNSAKYQDDVSITIYGWNIEIAKEYKLSTEDNWGFGKYKIGNGNDVYKTKDGSGYIKFTRYDNAVASGTFEFTAYNPSGVKVEITEGFFDIKR